MTHEEQLAANKRIAELLGWRVEVHTEPTFQGADSMTVTALIRPDGTMAWFHPLREPTVEECWRQAPNYTGDLNAVTDVLMLHDISLYLDFGPAYAARIIPEGRVDDPPMQEFYAGNTSAHETIQELAGAALLEYLEARATKGGGS